MLSSTSQLVLTALFPFIVTASLFAQSTTERVFYFAHTPTEQGTREIASAIRVIAGAQDVSPDFSAGTLSVHGTADQLELAEWLFLGMDRSVPVSPDTAVHEYRLREGPDNVVRLFHLDRGQTVKDFQEFATLVRQIAEIPREYPINGSKILAMRGTADQISMADYFTNELEKSAGAPHPHSMTSEYLLPAGPRPNENVTRILFVANSPTIQDLQELATLIRSIAEIRRLFTYSTPKAIAVRGTTDEVACAEWLFNEIDQPRNAESSHASAPYKYRDSMTTENASSVRVFYLHHTANPQDFQKIADTIRTTTGIRRMFTYASARALALRATLDQVEQAQRLLTQLDPADFPMAP